MKTDEMTVLAETLADAFEALANEKDGPGNPRSYNHGARDAYRHAARLVRANFATPKEVARVTAEEAAFKKMMRGFNNRHED